MDVEIGDPEGLTVGGIRRDDHIDFNNDDISQVLKHTEIDHGSESEYRIMLPSNHT